MNGFYLRLRSARVLLIASPYRTGLRLLLWVSRLCSPWSAHSLDYPTSLSIGYIFCFLNESSRFHTRLALAYSPKAMVTFSLGLTLEIAMPFGSTRYVSSSADVCRVPKVPDRAVLVRSTGALKAVFKPS